VYVIAMDERAGLRTLKWPGSVPNQSRSCPLSLTNPIIMAPGNLSLAADETLKSTPPRKLRRQK